MCDPMKKDGNLLIHIVSNTQYHTRAITQELLTFILPSTACNLDSMRYREDSTVLEKVEKASSRSLHLHGAESAGSIALSVCVCFSAVPTMMWNTFSSDLRGISDELESDSESE